MSEAAKTARVVEEAVARELGGKRGSDGWITTPPAEGIVVGSGPAVTVLDDVFTVWWDGAGEEVTGFLLYGLRANGGLPAPALSAQVLGPAGPIDYYRLFGEDWEVWKSTVCLPPAARPQVGELISRAMASLLEQGCAVAWVAPEGQFSDPPYLFLPAETSRPAVLVAMTSRGLLGSLPSYERPASFLTSEELLELRAASGGLAEAPTDYGTET